MQVNLAVVAEGVLKHYSEQSIADHKVPLMRVIADAIIQQYNGNNLNTERLVAVLQIGLNSAMKVPSLEEQGILQSMLSCKHDHFSLDRLSTNICCDYSDYPEYFNKMVASHHARINDMMKV